MKNKLEVIDDFVYEGVLLDIELYEYTQSIETHVGITVARPLEVKQVK